MTDKEALILLNMAKGVGSIRLKALIEVFGSPVNIINASLEKLLDVRGIGLKISREINSLDDDGKLEKELKLIKEYGVKVITIFDDDYPSALKNIYEAPIVIYVKGEFKVSDEVNLAIVGSRHASYYGLNCAEKFARELAGLNITVISGLARGVDTAAHKGALKSGGRTIAVVGNGLSTVYPPENKELFESISSNGAIISEFAMSEPPQARNFPRRNRIISGLSCGVLIIEAARNSGALITADFALEQGKDVFALPGKVNEETSFGTNELIKQGAKLVVCVEDILEELKTKISMELGRKNITNDPGLFIKLDLNDDEFKIFNVLSREPKHIEIIAKESSLPVSNCLGILLKMELKKIVEQLPGKQFVLKEEILINE
jgi:DNA processing protein